MQNQLPVWVQYIQALGTPILVALIGALIAYRQTRIAHNKLLLDLFDKRWKIYEAATSFVADALTAQPFSPEKVFQFRGDTHGARWLLSPSVATYLGELAERGMEFHCVNVEARTNTARRHELEEQRRKLLEMFSQEFQAIDRHFGPFLSIKHKGWV